MGKRPVFRPGDIEIGSLPGDGERYCWKTVAAARAAGADSADSGLLMLEE